MQLTASIYQYNIEILSQAGKLDQILSALLILIWIVLLILLPKVYIWFAQRTAAKNKLIQRATIWDLIAMKEIQTEIDTEMREALIRSELRSNETAVPLSQQAGRV